MCLLLLSHNSRRVSIDCLDFSYCIVRPNNALKKININVKKKILNRTQQDIEASQPDPDQKSLWQGMEGIKMNPTDRTRDRDYAVPELMAKRLCVRNVVPRLCCNQWHTYPALLPVKSCG